MHWLLLIALMDAAAAATLDECNALPEGQRMACYDEVMGVAGQAPPDEAARRASQDAAERIRKARQEDRERGRPPYEVEQAERARRLEEATACASSERMRDAILAGQLIIGMTAREVVCAYGGYQPNDIHRTTTARGTVEQWGYGGLGIPGTKYLYLEDGVLRAIQD